MNHGKLSLAFSAHTTCFFSLVLPAPWTLKSSIKTTICSTSSRISQLHGSKILQYLSWNKVADIWFSRFSPLIPNITRWTRKTPFSGCATHVFSARCVVWRAERIFGAGHSMNRINSFCGEWFGVEPMNHTRSVPGRLTRLANKNR